MRLYSPRQKDRDQMLLTESTESAVILVIMGFDQ